MSSGDEEGGGALVFRGRDQKKNRRLPNKQPKLEPLGKNRTPGQAEEGSEYAVIEDFIAKYVLSNRDTDVNILELLETRIAAFAVVKATGRPLCTHYISRCFQYFQKRHNATNEAIWGPAPASTASASTAPSTVSAEMSHYSGSQRQPSKSSRTSAPYSNSGGQPSNLDLDAQTDTMIIVIPGDVNKPETPKPVLFKYRIEGGSSYISSNVVQRNALMADPNGRRVVLTLRYQTMSDEQFTTVSDGRRRCRSYILPGCTFKVVDDLPTDIAVGIDLRERIRANKDPVDSFYTHSSTAGPVSTPRPRRPTSPTRPGDEVASSAGSSHGGIPLRNLQQNFLDAFNRIA